MPSLEDACDSSGDEEEPQITVVSDPFESYENEEIRNSKKMRRGLLYVKSKYVGDMKDCLKDRVHYFQGKVRASMNLEAYTVYVAISQTSGMVLSCKCVSCPVRALCRCSHISAVLLQILLHVKLNGPGGEYMVGGGGIVSVAKLSIVIMANIAHYVTYYATKCVHNKVSVKKKCKFIIYF